MQRLQGKTAIVTGGAKGIGAAIARRFAAEGGNVFIADLNLDRARETASEIAAKGGSATACQLDISDRAGVDELIAGIEARHGAIGVLVNNAGVNVFHAPLDLMDEDWDRCMAVDLKGAWNCSRAVLPGMVDRRYGAIINIISNHAFSVIKSTFPYPVAKHGLLGMTRALALEYADRGIAINAISPGYTDTDLAAAEFAKSPDPATARAQAEAKQPVGRLCRPDEVAAIAALLASDEARFMIGENIVIDGGVTIRMYE
ncbi:SDR family oxidoreductase [Thalassospira marina]|uniref:Short-chain dehydrogenase n=1 Tax=Thalassospira marina TaxID=2048283 RepID=A0ABM6QGL7_9PROT|nr:SDR family oxidoreductase [Thalassospira marina]AUG55755.1 short-chain dehydrogenase [Thalassospira marina]